MSLLSLSGRNRPRPAAGGARSPVMPPGLGPAAGGARSPVMPPGLGPVMPPGLGPGGPLPAAALSAGPALWQPALMRLLGPLDPVARDEVLAILSLLQDQGVPVPPPLAVVLQALLADPADADLPLARRRSPAVGPATAFAPLLAAIPARLADGLAGPGAAGRVLPAIALFRARGFTLLRIMVPLLRLAMVGQAAPMVLLAGPGHPTDRATGDRLIAQEQHLARSLTALCSPAAPRALGPFWRARALLLLALADGRAAAGGADPGLPLPDEAMVQLLDGAAPAVVPPPRRRRRLVVAAERSGWRRQGLRPQQDGVADIRHTTRLDDLNHALLSELALPDLLRNERLLGSGFLMRHRPPPLDIGQELLLVGLAPGGLEAPCGHLARLVWLDLAARARLLLVDSRAARGRLAWADRAPAGGLRALTAELAALPAAPVGAVDPWTIGADERWQLIAMAGWRRAVLDLTPLWPTAPGGAPSAADAADPTLSWLAQAWAHLLPPATTAPPRFRWALVTVAVPDGTGPAQERRLLALVRRLLAASGDPPAATVVVQRLGAALAGHGLEVVQDGRLRRLVSAQVVAVGGDTRMRQDLIAGALVGDALAALSELMAGGGGGGGGGGGDGAAGGVG